MKAEVRLPVKLTINTPRGEREAGPGMHEVVAAHEFVHALGHAPHNSHLMAQTLHKVMGDRSAGDKLRAGSDSMPPLQLSDESVELRFTVNPAIREAADLPGLQVNVTGPAGILTDLIAIFGAIDTTLLGATALIV